MPSPPVPKSLKKAVSSARKLAGGAKRIGRSVAGGAKALSKGDLQKAQKRAGQASKGAKKAMKGASGLKKAGGKQVKGLKRLKQEFVG